MIAQTRIMLMLTNDGSKDYYFFNSNVLLGIVSHSRLYRLNRKHRFDRITNSQSRTWSLASSDWQMQPTKRNNCQKCLIYLMPRFDALTFVRGIRLCVHADTQIKFQFDILQINKFP